MLIHLPITLPTSLKLTFYNSCNVMREHNRRVKPIKKILNKKSQAYNLLLNQRKKVINTYVLYMWSWTNLHTPIIVYRRCCCYMWTITWCNIYLVVWWTNIRKIMWASCGGNMGVGRMCRLPKKRFCKMPKRRLCRLGNRRLCRLPKKMLCRLLNKRLCSLW